MVNFSSINGIRFDESDIEIYVKARVIQIGYIDQIDEM